MNQSINIDTLLPDSLIESDLRRILSREGLKCEVTGEKLFKVYLDDKTIIMPENLKLDVISKAYITNKYDVGFDSDYFWAWVAVGGVRNCSNGIIDPKYCFARPFYTLDGRVITVDFSSSM